MVRHKNIREFDVELDTRFAGFYEFILDVPAFILLQTMNRSADELI